MSEPTIAAPGAHPLRALSPRDRTVQELVVRQFRDRADDPLLRGPADRTYGETHRQVAGVVAWLEARAVGEGERVVVVSENRVELLDLFLGCAFAGAIYVPVNPFLRGEQLRHQLEDAAPTLVLCEQGTHDQVREVLTGFSDPPELLVLGEGTWELDGATPPRPSTRELSAGHPPSHPTGVLYTSGTTGPSKGVVCPAGQFFWWGVLTAEYLRLRPSDHLYTTLPLYHINALGAYLQAIGVGASYTFRRGFSASRFIAEAREAEATVTYLLGAMLTILWKQEPSERDREHDLRVALAPATPPDIFERFRERFGFDLVDGFGMTELNLVVSSLPEATRPGRMGWVLDDFEARVVDDEDIEVSDGEPGELVVRPREPHSMCQGYWRRPEATAEAWANLWFHTQDRVVRDDDGALRYLDRMKDAIRRRGENISSFEVEAVVANHPAVAEAACIGVPSELGEEEVMVHVVPQPGEQPSGEDIVRWCADRLAHFAVPRYIAVVGDLPRTPNGKVRKAALREQGAATGTFDREAAGVEIRRG
ncbi:ATP-dependent acyl-CoA ligase [Egibacter rhizosphaerae]|uniref:ATP-dependent acyl-CoA ligase n=1 Tax=Egibacter rhizosphaerae TaxID=1670831 RepID=A0A411YGJ8_9ACTN|nr:AMP-binding protein [Egibacter rhizosphaerae]QBI20415.1 ATP-dependent acyl-CoA ligase [Egibacter rhizosphaerae]